MYFQEGNQVLIGMNCVELPNSLQII